MSRGSKMSRQGKRAECGVGGKHWGSSGGGEQAGEFIPRKEKTPSTSTTWETGGIICLC